MKLLPLIMHESQYFKDKVEHIDLVECPNGGEVCKNQLNYINEKIQSSRVNWLNKDYPKALDDLKNAFETTFEVDKELCIPCADLFRATILKAVENIFDDLQQLTSGILRKKRYQSELELAEKVLRELKEKS